MVNKQCFFVVVVITVNIEKHDREQSEKEKSLHDETPGKNEATRPVHYLLFRLTL